MTDQQDDDGMELDEDDNFQIMANTARGPPQLMETTDRPDLSSPALRGLYQTIDTVQTIVQGSNTMRAHTALLSRFAHALEKHPALRQSIDPFHLYLLVKTHPELAVHVPADAILDMQVLRTVAQSGVDKAYWRILYMFEFKRAHGTWPMGFDGVEPSMRRWCRHLYKCTNKPTPTLLMDRFPQVPKWTQVRLHPLELMAAQLLLHVLVAHNPSIQWPAPCLLRTRQAILLQCLRAPKEHGRALFERLCMRISMGPIEQYQSVICTWLTSETGYFSNLCLDRDHVDNWLRTLNVPTPWIASALLVQQRLELLNDDQLFAVLVRFLGQNTSLPVTPRPAWIDADRVRLMFKEIVKSNAVSTDTFLCNMDRHSATAQTQVLDLLTSIRELKPFMEVVLRQYHAHNPVDTEALEKEFAKLSLGKK